jgi:O-antigen ligase
MDAFRRLEPTPQALRNGRRLLVLLVALLAVVTIVTLLGSGFDTATLAITIATCVTVIGHVIAYVGQPSLLRYRVGLVVAAVGIVTAFWMLITDSFAMTST